MQRMSWLLSQHVLVYRVDSHTSHLNPKAKGTNSWQMSVDQALEVTNALSYYSANDLDNKLERVTGHGFTKPNNSRFPTNQKK